MTGIPSSTKNLLLMFEPNGPETIEPFAGRATSSNLAIGHFISPAPRSSLVSSPPAPPPPDSSPPTPHECRAWSARNRNPHPPPPERPRRNAPASDSNQQLRSRQPSPRGTVPAPPQTQRPEIR